MTNWKRVPPAALDAAPDCLVVSRFGVGLDNIPVDRATELGILVTNVPDFCLEEVSDHAMALLLACARRVVTFASSTRSGEWNLELGRGLPRLRGQTLGLVGLGNIARALVPKAQGFGLEVIAYTPRLTRETAPPGVTVAASLDELLATADYVSLHAPSTPETRGLIGEAELRRMKPTAYLVNTSRGALVDEGALARAVEERWIAGAAVDVLTQEPPDRRQPAPRARRRHRHTARWVLLRGRDRGARGQGGTQRRRRARRPRAAHRRQPRGPRLAGAETRAQRLSPTTARLRHPHLSGLRADPEPGRRGPRRQRSRSDGRETEAHLRRCGCSGSDGAVRSRRSDHAAQPGGRETRRRLDRDRVGASVPRGPAVAPSSCHNHA